MNAKDLFFSRLEEIKKKLDDISKSLPGEKSHYVRQQLSFQYKCLVGVKDVNEKLLTLFTEKKLSLKAQ
jgi:hypothetical protein